jgi:hypothetical protein
MSDLIQLVYASRSNLESTHDAAGVEPGVARILTQSRRNNKPKNIGGVLCFGDGHFFQCLEGEREPVEALYAHLHEDARHRDVTLLLKRKVEQREFKLWAMKYLSVDRVIREQLEREGLDRFDPYQFNEAAIDRMLKALREVTEKQPVQPGNRAPEPSGADRRGDGLPLAWLGAGAVLAALVAIGVLAFGVL